MSGALDTVRRAHEEKFFKRAQEDEVRAYVARLRREGRYEAAMREASERSAARGGGAGTSTLRRGGSALPQIMAHDLRLSASAEVVKEQRVIDREFMNRHRLVNNLRMTDGFLLGGRVSLGKNKWVAGTVESGVEGATIFSVHKAGELMSTAPPRTLNGVESRAARHMVDTSFVELAGKKIKLMPDPTPGRAMAWGGTLAVWGTLGLTLTACKALGIHNIDDVTIVMKRQLTPLGDSIKSSMLPLKTQFAMDPAHDAPKFKDSDFASGIRRVFA